MKPRRWLLSNNYRCLIRNLVFVMMSSLLFITCKDAVAPFDSEYQLKEGKKLYIVDGFYKQVATNHGQQLKYFYEFSVFVIEECKIDGY